MRGELSDSQAKLGSQNGVNYNHQHEFGKTPLMIAIESGNCNLVRWLVEELNVDVDGLSDSSGKTARALAYGIARSKIKPGDPRFRGISGRIVKILEEHERTVLTYPITPMPERKLWVEYIEIARENVKLIKDPRLFGIKMPRYK